MVVVGYDDACRGEVAEFLDLERGCELDIWPYVDDGIEVLRCEGWERKGGKGFGMKKEKE